MYWLTKHLIQPLPVLLLLCGLGIYVLWVKRPISTKTLMVVTAPVCVHGANASANDTPTLPLRTTQGTDHGLH